MELILQLWPYILLLFVLLVLVLPSFRVIGPTQVGLVTKRFSFKKLSEDDPIAFRGEAGYQADMLMPGLRWKFWVIYSVDKFPWVQVPAGQIAVVIAQVGKALPVGAKSAVYRKQFGNFSDLRGFLENGGEKGVQRPVLPPGTLIPIHPVAFLVITRDKTYGIPVSPQLKKKAMERAGLSPMAFGLQPKDFEVTVIRPMSEDEYGTGAAGYEIAEEDFEEMPRRKPPRIAPHTRKTTVDIVGVVTVLEGEPLPPGSIASRLGGWRDIEQMEKSPHATELELIEKVLATQNEAHNNYQDFQAFLDNGGKIGMQHDVLLYGAYTLNPFLVKVELVPMLVVEQGEVAVIKSYVGLGTVDTSGEEFKFGSLVKPGHRGIWQEPLRTGKYPLNPHIYKAEIVPTFILTLNWAEAISKAHQLDRHLQAIIAKSREGFVFTIDLQVQIHVPDTRAPKVISIVGTMANLVNEVLQAAVGNHFRDKIQSMPAITFIETRQHVQEEAFKHIEGKLKVYEIETKGVYIQDVILPEQLVSVLTQREIAHQEIETFKRQKDAQDQRVETEKSRGTADMQAELAKSAVGVEIKANNAEARKAEANGEAFYISETGRAKSAEVEAVGMARAKAYEAQVKALGRTPTALVNVATVLSERNIKIVPEVLVSGSGGSLDGLAATLTRHFTSLAATPNKTDKPDTKDKVADQKSAEPPKRQTPPPQISGEDAKRPD
ncbi:MAG: SPFH domain-containing protein [Planctomycetota bacterium]|jgi:regulator of protease activity HflC (stomatin/prohibitin superfamily)